MEAIKNMNGTLWIFAAILISMVLVQSFLFLRMALKFNKKHKLVTVEELKEAATTGVVSSIGPSLNSIVTCLALIAMVGSATAFMRCGVIGAPMMEMYMANIASTVSGVTLGGEGFTESVFTLAIFCMVMGSAPYFINTSIMLKPLDTMLEKSKAKNAKVSFLPYLSRSAMFSLITYMMFNNVKTIPALAAFVVAVIVWCIINKIAKTIGSKMLSSFGMGIGMIFGMAAGQILTVMMG